MPQVFTHNFETAPFKGEVSLNTGLFINGTFVDSVENATLEVFRPTTGQVLTTIAAATVQDVDIAVQAAKTAFETSWGLKVPGHERGRLLNKLADRLEEHLAELAALEALNVGKPYPQALRDISGAISTFRYYAGWADKNNGKTTEVDETRFCYTRNEPIGVCGLIVPWNFPLLITSWKVAPALATGNSIILKPSEITPLTALKLAEYAHDVGFPAGVVNVLPGLGSVTGQALAEHPDVGKIAFTGSTLIGRKIMETAARTNLKRLSLELGGKNPTIVFDDAELDQAVKWALEGSFFNNGQVCCAGSVVYVQEGVYDDFMKAFVAASKARQVGDNFDSTNAQGPLVSSAHMQRVLSYIEAGKQEGARLISGGSQVGRDGYYVEPTIFSDVQHDMKIMKEEIFGPVSMVVKFKTEEEVLKLANSTVYGLSSNIFTQNINRALRVTNALQAGNTFVNQVVALDTRVAFGGIKQSGFGKDLGEYALENYTNVKAVHINLGRRL